MTGSHEVDADAAAFWIDGVLAGQLRKFPFLLYVYYPQVQRCRQIMGSLTFIYASQLSSDVCRGEFTKRGVKFQKVTE